MIIFSFFCEFNVFSKENFKVTSNFLGTLQKYTHDETRQQIKLALPVKFAYKPELNLTRLLGNTSTRVTLSHCKQALSWYSVDCDAGGRGFDFQGRTITQGLKITEK